jgi:hypothetical protein
VYLLLNELTEKKVLIAGVVLLMGTFPGLISLLAIFEDNIIASLTQVQYLYVYFQFIKSHQAQNDYNHRKALLNFFLPLSLLIAILGHRQNGVVIITPLFFWFFLSDLGKKEKLKVIVKTYVIVTILFLLVYAFMAYVWHHHFGLNQWLDDMFHWFIPGNFYRGFYFFNKFGWDFARQALEIYKGISQLFFYGHSHVRYGILLYIFLVLITVYGTNGIIVFHDWKTKVVLLFLIINIPHSLIYESANLERWDVLFPVLTLLIGIFAKQALKAMKMKIYRFSIPSLHWLILIFGIVFLYDLYSYQLHLQELYNLHSSTTTRDFIKKLQVNVQTSTASDKKNILLLNQNEFNGLHSDYHYYMVAQAYYSYEDSIFALLPDGRVFKSEHRYLRPREVSPMQFSEYIRNANLIMNKTEEALLNKLITESSYNERKQN